MITRPAWAKGAIPTERGWVRGRELLTCRRHTPEEIAEWTAAQEAPVKKTRAKVVAKVIAPTPSKRRAKKIVEETTVTETTAVSLTEAPISNVTIGNMTVPQVEALETQYGVKIDQVNNQTLTESSDKSED